MIIIEGMNGAGKSVLSKTLLEKYPGKILLPSKGIPTSFEEVERRLFHEEKLKNEGHDVILDRCSHISEIVYNQFHDWSCNMHHARLVNFFKDLAPFVVYCRQPKDIAREIWADRITDKYFKLDTVAKMINSFDAVYKLYDLVMRIIKPTVLYDYRIDPVDKVFEAYEKFCEPKYIL